MRAGLSPSHSGVWAAGGGCKTSQSCSTTEAAQPSLPRMGGTPNSSIECPLLLLFFQIHGWQTIVKDTPKIYFSLLAPRTTIAGKIAWSFSRCRPRGLVGRSVSKACALAGAHQGWGRARGRECRATGERTDLHDGHEVPSRYHSVSSPKISPTYRTGKVV